VVAEQAATALLCTCDRRASNPAPGSAPDRTYDLGDREALRLMYETVLREAIHYDELTR
jgi:hypothetical protein